MSPNNQATFVSRRQRLLSRRAKGTPTRRLFIELLEDRSLLATVRGTTAIDQARDYLIAHADSLGLDSPGLSDLAHVFTHHGSVGSVERFEQRVQGLQVYGAEIAVTLLDSGEVTYVYNTYQPGLQLASTMPAVAPADARLAAAAAFDLQGPYHHELARLLVFPDKAGAHLAWQVELSPISGKNGAYEVIVDARSGAILQARDQAQRATGTGMVFNPDPLTTANAVYGAAGYTDANDADSTQLNAQRQSVTLQDITLAGGTYSLVGPFAHIVDVESPSNGLFAQTNSNFSFTRNQNGFEAVNAYYHLDKFLRYLNVTLGLDTMPIQYTGGVRFDPSGESGGDDSHYDPATGVLVFGEGGVDDAEDADVLIHELGHGIHDWVTGGNLSSEEGLSEGIGDYFAQSYSRALGLWPLSNPAYQYTYSWDGHNQYWAGRTTNYTAHYPTGLTGDEHDDGQIWATANMKVWDLLGATRTDTLMVEGLAMTGAMTNQEEAAQALLQAAFNLGYSTTEIHSIFLIYQDTGYLVTEPIPPTLLQGTVWNDLNGNGTREAGENGQSGWTVYVDTNDNGTREAGSGTFISTDVPKTLPDLATVTSQTVVSTLTEPITDVNVTLSLTHTFDRDLEITLISPLGTRVKLAQNVGNSGQNFTSTVFDQQASSPISSGSAPFTGTFRPTASLDVLNGTAGNGIWKLEVIDTAGSDSGSLTSWELAISSGEASAVTSSTGTYVLSGLTGGNYTLREVAQATWAQTVPVSGSYSVTLATGETESNLDFANTQAAVPATFQVLTSSLTSTGAVISLSRDVAMALLNLYDTQGNPFGPADVTLVGATVGDVKGSLIVDPNLRRLTFVKTVGMLAPDTYMLTLRSAANGFLDTSAALLDGDANDTPAGNYVRTFVVDPPATGAVTLSIGNFARGPQQPVNLPANGTSGVPVSFSNGAGITSASFQLRYNPALLNISGAQVAPGLLAGATVNINLSTPGVAVVQFNSPTPLTADTTRFIDLYATVPADAPYGAKHVLDISNIVLNDNMPTVDDDAVAVTAYFGDVTGDGTYSAQDASLIARLAVGLDTGFDDFQLLDPKIIGDITGDGSISAQDVSYMLQLAVSIPVPEVQTPLPTVSLLRGGPDPKLSIPQNLIATAGDSLVIPVDIDSIVDLTGNGLASADLVIYYDPTVLDITAASLGQLIANRGWLISSRVNPLAGRIDISLAGTNKLEGTFHGELAKLQATVKAGAKPGASAINLAATSRMRTTQLNEGFLTLIPAPTDAANDPIDGRVMIRANETTVTSAENTARLVGEQLLITGSAGNDRILVAPTIDGRLRVRVGGQLLGDFAATGVAIDSLTGNDFIYVAPLAPAALIVGELSERDQIFGGENTRIAPSEAPDSDQQGTAVNSGFENAALLQLLANWSDEFRDQIAIRRSTSISLVRRR